MTGTILDKIIDAKRQRVESLKQESTLSGLMRAAEQRDPERRNIFRRAISSRGVNIVAEFKRASPSKGVINSALDPAETACSYIEGGASAVSVLTEEDFFKGSTEDLRAVRNAVQLPILRKDFVIDEFQIIESAAAGADAILLIVGALYRSQLAEFKSAADSLGLDSIVEVHDRNELEIADAIGAEIVGVNNRNLKTFHVTLDVSRELIGYAPKGAIMITESGITEPDEIEELQKLGYSGFLIGETLMRSGDPVSELRRLRGMAEAAFTES